MKKIFCALLCVAYVNTPAQSFSTPIPMEDLNGSGGNLGPHCSQQIVNGNPAIAYYDSQHGDLRYTRANDASGNTWGDPIIVADRYDVGKFCEMKIIQGNPAIAYVDQTHQILKYVRATDPNGTTWSSPVTVDNSINLNPCNLSLADVNGNPAISYCEGLNITLKYARAVDNLGNTWNTPITVQSVGQVGFQSVLAVINGNPGIVYTNSTTETINFMRSTDAVGTNWGLPVPISSVGEGGYELSCAFTQGKLAVCYTSLNIPGLRFVIASDSNATSWQSPITIETGVGNGRYTSMLYSSGRLMISYYSSITSGIQIVRSLDQLGTAWAASVSVQPSPVYEKTSIAIANGRPIIAWCSSGPPNSVMQFIAALDSIGSAWGQPITFSTPRAGGVHPSLLEINGKPAMVASTFGSNGKMLFNTANDTEGQDWNSSLQLLNAGTPGSLSSAEKINGKPAFAYIANGLNYTRALDSTGSLWSSSVRLDSGASFRNLILVTLHGRPCVAYFDFTNSSLRFTCSNDSSGTSWMPHTLPVSSFNTDWFDMKVVNGRPSIAYVDNSANLIYVTSTDSFGQSWAPPIVIDNINPTQGKPGLNVINGNPVVIYSDLTSALPAFRIALNPNGTMWGGIIQPSQTAFNGTNFELIIHDNRPVTTYLGIDFECYVLAANDATGSTWSSEVFIDSTNFNTLQKVDLISLPDGHVGVGYYRVYDKYAYYSGACIAPLGPQTSGSANICLGTNAVLSASGFGTLSWYSSSTGGTYLGTGSSFTTPALTSTTTYYVQDSTCAASTRTAVTVTVNPLPTISLSGNTQLCSGDSTTLSVSGNGDGFEWSTGSLNMNETFTPASTTNYWVTTYDGAGCVDTIFFAVNVTTPQTTTQTVPLCAGDSYSVGNNTYSAAGTYTDSLTTVQAGCDSVVVTTITIQSAIDTTVNYTSGILASNESGATYQWINCTTQQIISGAINQNFTPTQNGTYAVVILNGPCEDTSVCYTVTDVGMDEIVSNAAALVVTTASGQINALVQTGTSIVTYEFYNALGELVFSTSGQVGEIVSYHARSAGMYVVKAAASGSTMVKRVLVQ